MNGKETSNYPNIKWKDDKRTFYYKIIKAGTYPQESMLYQTQRPHSYYMVIQFKRLGGEIHVQFNAQ